LDLLKTTPLQPNDVVVFYDGGMDIDMQVFRGVLRATCLRRTLMKIHDKFGDRCQASQSVELQNSVAPARPHGSHSLETFDA
jgi:hypothetical protein